MKAIVTGAGGFIGANLTRRLVSTGHEVDILVRSRESWRLRETGSTQIHELDIRNRLAVAKLVQEIRPDVVFHLAAFGAYPSQTDLEEMVSTNFMGCVSLLDACVAADVSAFIQAGSSSEYGYKNHPAHEGERIEPNSNYATTKAAATHYCQRIARESNVHAVTLRFYSVYGPLEEPSRLIPTLLTYGIDGRLPNLVSPSTARDFVYIDDAVDAMLEVAAKTNLPRGSVYNVCTGLQTRLVDVVALVRNILNLGCEPVWSSMEQRAWDTDFWVGSPLQMQQAVGWRHRVNLREGIDRTLHWLRTHPEWLQFYREKIGIRVSRERAD